MPRPRFDKLPPEKRERILEAAAQAFAASGFEGASLNQILDAADISKGAAYYYFDDKADLFASVVVHYFGVFFEEPPQHVIGAPSAEGFWEELVHYYRGAMQQLANRPWMLGLTRAVWRLPPELRGSGPLKPLFDAGQAWLQQLVQQGRAIGAIRTDLPEDLLVAWLAGLDLVTDQWIAEHLDRIDDEVIDIFTRLAIDTLHRLFDPPTPGQEVVLNLSGSKKE
jgi:AcrR family transcriptional regulator